MSALKQVFTETFKAAVAITAGQAVKLTANENEVTPTTAAVDVPVGVAIESQAIVGEGVVVLVMGEAWINTAAAVAIGGRLCLTATAGAVDDTAITIGSHTIIGIALSAVGAAGQVRALINCPGAFASVGTT